MHALHRTASRNRAFGIECHLVSPQESADLWDPQGVGLMRTDDLEGGLWIPGEAFINAELVVGSVVHAGCGLTDGACVCAFGVGACLCGCGNATSGWNGQPNGLDHGSAQGCPITWCEAFRTYTRGKL